MIYGYARILSKQRGEDRQIIALRIAGVQDECIVSDIVENYDSPMTGYLSLMEKLQPGDLLVIKSMDRIGRNYGEILGQWKFLVKEKRVSINVLDMPMFNTSQGNDKNWAMMSGVVLQILTNVAQTEKEFLKQRQAEGIAAAKERGVRFGRRPLEIPEDFISLGYFAYYFLIERLPVRSVAILSYFDPAVAVFASAFILREPTSVYSYIGAALIFAASIASELHSGKADISADDIEQR